MKRVLVFGALLCALVLSSISSPSVPNAVEAATKEKAVITFTNSVMLMGVELKGTYLFVHDDQAMARGDACTYVYKGEAESRSKLVVSFHCKPIDRSKVDRFRVRSILNADGKDELTELQFSGSTEGHLVPVRVQ